MDIEPRDHWLPESCQHLKAFWSVNVAKVLVILCDSLILCVNHGDLDIIDIDCLNFDQDPTEWTCWASNIPTPLSGMGRFMQDISIYCNGGMLWGIPILLGKALLTYCSWFRNPVNSPVEGQVVNIYHYLQGFSTIPDGCLGFLNHQHSKVHGVEVAARCRWVLWCEGKLVPKMAKNAFIYWFIGWASPQIILLNCNIYQVVVSNISLCSPRKFGEMESNLTNIFQMGWN